MTAQYPAMSLADIDLSDTGFWARPLVERPARSAWNQNVVMRPGTASIFARNAGT